MSKNKEAKAFYRCSACGYAQSKWAGQCPGCGEWNVMHETMELPSNFRYSGYAGNSDIAVPVDLASIEAPNISRTSSGLDELDRVLGGGLVPGSAVLIGGDPGIGKSTLLLQSVVALRQRMRPLYVTGEESIEQVGLRAGRLQLAGQGVQVLSETSLERILASARQHQARLLVVDSIQTIYSEQLQSAPGSVAQVR